MRLQMSSAGDPMASGLGSHMARLEVWGFRFCKALSRLKNKAQDLDDISLHMRVHEHEICSV